jgi:hypothetical protein
MWDSHVLNEVGRLNDIELTKKFGGSGQLSDASLWATIPPLSWVS